MRGKLRPEEDVESATSSRRKGGVRGSFSVMDVPAGSKEFASLNKRRDIFLIFCGTLSVFAGACGGLCALAFGMALVEVRFRTSCGHR